MLKKCSAMFLAAFMFLSIVYVSAFADSVIIPFEDFEDYGDDFMIPANTQMTQPIGEDGVLWKCGAVPAMIDTTGGNKSIKLSYQNATPDFRTGVSAVATDETPNVSVSYAIRIDDFNTNKYVHLHANNGQYIRMYWTVNGSVQLNSTEYKGWKYELGVWYDVTLNWNLKTGIMSFAICKNGDRVYNVQNITSSFKGDSMIYLIFGSGSSANLSSFCIDDISADLTPAPAIYPETGKILANETFETGGLVSGYTTKSATITAETIDYPEGADGTKAMHAVIPFTTGNNYYDINTSYVGSYISLYKSSFDIRFLDGSCDFAYVMYDESGGYAVMTIKKDGTVTIGSKQAVSQDVIKFKRGSDAPWYNITLYINAETAEVGVVVKAESQIYNFKSNIDAPRGLACSTRARYTVSAFVDENVTTEVYIDNIRIEAVKASDIPDKLLERQYFDFDDFEFTNNAYRGWSLSNTAGASVEKINTDERNVLKFQSDGTTAPELATYSLSNTENIINEMDIKFAKNTGVNYVYRGKNQANGEVTWKILYKIDATGKMSVFSNNSTSVNIGTLNPGEWYRMSFEFDCMAQAPTLFVNVISLKDGSKIHESFELTDNDLFKLTGARFSLNSDLGQTPTLYIDNLSYVTKEKNDVVAINPIGNGVEIKTSVLSLDAERSHIKANGSDIMLDTSNYCSAIGYGLLPETDYDISYSLTDFSGQTIVGEATIRTLKAAEFTDIKILDDRAQTGKIIASLVGKNQKFNDACLFIAAVYSHDYSRVLGVKMLQMDYSMKTKEYVLEIDGTDDESPCCSRAFIFDKKTLAPAASAVTME